MGGQKQKKQKQTMKDTDDLKIHFKSQLGPFYYACILSKIFSSTKIHAKQIPMYSKND